MTPSIRETWAMAEKERLEMQLPLIRLRLVHIGQWPSPPSERRLAYSCAGVRCALQKLAVTFCRRDRRTELGFASPSGVRASFSSQTTSSSSVSSCSFFLRPSLATCLTAVSSRRSLFTHFPSLRFLLCSVLVTLALLSRFPSDRVHPFHPRTTNHDFPFSPKPRYSRILLQCRLDSFDRLFDDLAALPIRCMSL